MVDDRLDAKPGSCVILGGGLAGIAAAVRLAGQGLPVTLVETRKRLGGRATSFVDPTTGDVLDNCQHVVMKCCTNLLDLYERLGVADLIHWYKRFYFADAHGRVDELSAEDLPAPLHLTASLLGFSTLSWTEKFAIGRGMMAMMRTDRSLWADRSFAQWLEAYHQPSGAIEKFWRPVVVGAINERTERMAADCAIQVFQEGFLAHEQAYWMGLADVPLVRLYDQAQTVIEQAGGRVMLATSARELQYEQGRVTSLLIDDDQRLEADHFISTLPFDRLAKVAPPAMVRDDGRLTHLDELTCSPIIGIHLWLACEPDQMVFTLPHLSLMQSPLHWLFNKGYDAQAGGQHLHGVISAAHDLVDQTADQLAQMALAELRRVAPEARGVRLLHSRVIKEKRATFSAVPGSDRLRPGTRGAIPNLYLAGDWCTTGWPATMEGAVRSGYFAATAVMKDAGVTDGEQASLNADGLVPDLKPTHLYRLLAGR